MDKTIGNVYFIGRNGLIIMEGVPIIPLATKKKESVFVKKKSLTHCSSEPGIVYNGNVWLTERNDEFAKKLLYEYEIRRIIDLENQLRNRRNRIRLIW